MTPEQRLDKIEALLTALIKSDRFILERTFQMADGRHIQFGQTTGTRIGTATTQKLAFWGKTPVVQPGAIVGPGSGGTAADGNARSAINSIIDTLSTLGITA